MVCSRIPLHLFVLLRVIFLHVCLYINILEFIFLPSNFPVVQAIKLTFSSDKNAIKGDPSFKQKHRLFDFADYRYSSPDTDDTRPEVCVSMILISYIMNSCCSYKSKL